MSRQRSKPSKRTKVAKPAKHTRPAKTARTAKDAKAMSVPKTAKSAAPKKRPAAKRASKNRRQAKKMPVSWNRAGLALIAVGLSVLIIGLFGMWWNQRSAARPIPASQLLGNARAQNNGSPLIYGSPVHIKVPSVGIDINVIPGYYYPNTKSWTLTDNNAQFAVLTAKPNNKFGDTFIYGHALTNIFGKLPGVKPGDKAIVTTGNNHTFTYIFKKSSVTTPDNTALFKYRGSPILILQTCTGLWWQNRQLFVFNFSEVS